MNFLNVAIEAARKAGAMHLKYFSRSFEVKTKTASYDFVTEADLAAEKTIVSRIIKYFPEHNILAEEGKYRRTSSEYTWIIDPLDGTNNFVSSLPIFCVSIGLAYKNNIIAGVIFDPTRDELFYAQKDKGAFLNGKRIYVNQARNLTQSLLITGFYYDRGAEMVNTLKAIERFQYEKIIGIRRLGAAALDLCYVACGRAAGFWEFKLSPWDFAAGSVIIKEAGGKVTGRFGERVPFDEKHFIVSSNGKIHKQMLEVINRL